jgi:hypothetical protein
MHCIQLAMHVDMVYNSKRIAKFFDLISLILVTIKRHLHFHFPFRCDGMKLRVWIGLSDPTNSKEDLVWVDKTTFDYKYEDIQLNNHYGVEGCVRFAYSKSNWLWADVICGTKLNYVCNKGRSERRE